MRNNKGKNNPAYLDGRTLKKHYCKCGKEISYWSFFCGKGRCNSCAHIGKGNGNYKKGSYLKKYFCIDCGKEISLDSGLFGNGRCKLCSLLIQVGENSPGWKGGHSVKPYPSGWVKLTEQIRERDDHTCQLCGIPELECERRLHVHHKDYNKNNVDPCNLISLCITCHIKTNSNRDYWLKYFGCKEVKSIKERG